MTQRILETFVQTRFGLFFEPYFLCPQCSGYVDIPRPHVPAQSSFQVSYAQSSTKYGKFTSKFAKHIRTIGFE